MFPSPFGVEGISTGWVEYPELDSSFRLRLEWKVFQQKKCFCKNIRSIRVSVSVWSGRYFNNVKASCLTLFSDRFRLRLEWKVFQQENGMFIVFDETWGFRLRLEWKVFQQLIYSLIKLIKLEKFPSPFGVEGISTPT